MHYLLTFRSLTYAQQGSRILERAGVTGNIVRVPKEISVRGCSYGISVAERNGRAAVNVLQRMGYPPERTYRRREDGILEEMIP